MRTHHYRTHTTLLACLTVLVAGLAPMVSSGNAATAAPPSRPITWLAAGDSYSAGEGLIADKGEELCNRAQNESFKDKNVVPNGVGDPSKYKYPKAWAPAALDLLSSDNPRFAVADFRFNACSGATRNEFFSPQEDGSGQPMRDGRPQQWDKATRYDLVTFSLGGNDIGFADTLIKCLGVDHFAANYAFHLPWRKRAGCDPKDFARVDELLTGNPAISDTENEEHYPYEHFLRRVARETVNPGGAIIVVGYPNLVPDPGRWEVPNICQGIRSEDVVLLRAAAKRLNDAIAGAVADLNTHKEELNVTFEFVDLASAYKDHETCLPDSWVHGMTLSPRKEASFHPNADGYANTAQLVADRIRQIDWSNLTQANTETQAEPNDLSSLLGQDPATVRFSHQE